MRSLHFFSAFSTTPATYNQNKKICPRFLIMYATKFLIFDTCFEEEIKIPKKVSNIEIYADSVKQSV